MTTRTVVSGADSGTGTLRDILGLAANGDTIIFAPAVAAVTLGASLQATANLSFDGAAGRGGADVVLGGTGALLLSGSDELANLVLGGSLLLRNNGTVTQSGALTVGDGKGGAAKITNASGKTWAITGDVGIAAGDRLASFNNAGTLAKTGGHDVSVIGVNLVNGSGGAGAITVASGMLEFTGQANSFVGQAIGGAGTVALGGGGRSVFSGGTTFAAGGLVIEDAGTTLALGQDLSTAAAYTQQTGGGLDLAGHVLSLTGILNIGPLFATAGARLNSTAEGGRLVTSGRGVVGDVVVGSGIVWQNTALLSAFGTLQLGDGGSGLVRLANRTNGVFELGLNGSIVAGGHGLSSFNNNGGTLAKGNGTGTCTIAVSFQDGSGVAAKIQVKSGTLAFTGASNGFTNQAITGSGTFQIGGGGASTISGGTTIATAGWAIARAGTTVTLGQTLSYAGSFSDTNQTTLDLGSNTLTLSGSASFAAGPAGAPVVTGSGKLIATGTTTLGGLTMGGTMVFRNNGTLTQTGTIQAGDGTGAVSLLANGPGATWTLANDSDILQGSNPSTMLNNAGGTVIKSGGTGTSVIVPCLENMSGSTGTFEVASGTLELAGTLQGSLLLKIDAGTTLMVDLSSTDGTTARFNGSGGTLQLGEADLFQGQIAGFRAGQSLDLRSVSFGAGSSLAYAGGGGTGTLTVTDAGAHAVNLALAGTFTASSFHLASDSHGGSLVTYG